MERGAGSRLFDEDGNEYIDWRRVEPNSKTTATSIDHANALLLIAVLSAA
jgi:glutamate-1-semialdehyde aminotransferase